MVSEFLPDLTDVNVNRTVYHIYIVSPDLVQKRLAIFYFSFFACEVVKQLKLLSGQLKLLFPAFHDITVFIDFKIVDLQPANLFLCLFKPAQYSIDS